VQRKTWSRGYPEQARAKQGCLAEVEGFRNFLAGKPVGLRNRIGRAGQIGDRNFCTGVAGYNLLKFTFLQPE
jgi:hypothetical protein